MQIDVPGEAFFLELEKIPAGTAQMKGERILYKNGKPFIHHFPKPQITAARTLYLQQLEEYRPKKPLTGPVSLFVDFCYPAGKSHKTGDWKTTRPDTDNLLKLFKDCMTEAGFWKDDAQVVTEVVRKVYSDTPGIFVVYGSVGGKGNPDAGAVD